MSASRSGITDRRAWSTMKLSPISQPTVTPSWNSEFIHGYGCGLFGAVDPYTVLQPVCAAIAMTLMPLASRPSTGCRFLWLKASVSSTAAIASTSCASVIVPCSAS